MTVNQELQDIQITHTHYVERFKTYETNRIISILDSANAEIKKKLLSADITEFTKRRYESLLKSIEEARQVGFTIAHSPLVKTALFASDPNWGRILAAVGRSGIEDLEIDRVRIWLGDVAIVSGGGRDPAYTEAAGQAVMPSGLSGTAGSPAGPGPAGCRD